MTLQLTPDILRATYDFLHATPPFSMWNLPDSERITFKVTRKAHLQGHITYVAGGKITIEVSSVNVGHTYSLIQVMAHEMAHLFEFETGMDTKAGHSKAFKILAKRICDHHGFDPKLF